MTSQPSDTAETSEAAPAARDDERLPTSLTGPHILTVAIEDYFQVGAFKQRIQRGQWYRFENRVDRNTHAALDLLDEYDTKGTFFVLGWIAEQMPEIVREVVDRGHEVASRGYYHRSIRQMTPEEFREDVQRSGQAIERATGQRVRGYRVAHEWFDENDLWALDVLAEEGYAFDSSVGLLLRRFVREPWRRFVHEHRHRGRVLTEVPLSSVPIGGLSLPIAGGNYFRQFPHTLMKRGVAWWSRTYSAPYVMYFHVWELDQSQPRLNVPWLTRIRHYRNLGKLDWVLRDYFGRYAFQSIGEYLDLEPESVDVESLPRAPESQSTARSARAAEPPVEVDAEASERVPVTVVVPCYNEELVLPYLANTLRSVQEKLADRYDFRFLFVDDCSVDDTANALQQVFGAWPNARVLRHATNLGVAHAILTGIEAAETEIVCSIDCDCTYDPHQLEMMIPMLDEDVDLVTGSPYHRLGRVENVPEWRLFLSRGLSAIYRLTLNHKLDTYTSCFRAYRKSSLEGIELEQHGFLGVVELIARMDLSGAHIVECPSVLEVRMLGLSKMKTARTIVGHLKLLAQVWRWKLSGKVG